MPTPHRTARSHSLGQTQPNTSNLWSSGEGGECSPPPPPPAPTSGGGPHHHPRGEVGGTTSAVQLQRRRASASASLTADQLVIDHLLNLELGRLADSAKMGSHHPPGMDISQGGLPGADATKVQVREC